MASKALRATELEAILEKVRQVRNFDFRNYKRATLQRRIDRRVEATRSRTRAALLVVAHDITQQVHSERSLAQAQTALLEQEHLRALGEMASGVAHDLNNTLNAMKLRLELIQRQRAEPSNEQAQLQEVIAEALEIARGDIEHRAAREGLSVRFEVELGRCPPVNASAMDLRYVFINLLLNARDAMPRGGTIRVRGGVEDGKAVVTVEDEGTGIAEQHLRSLFRPFFTTKGKYGTGLGLSMAYGVMSRAGGSITAANRPTGGACFTLSFPLLAEQASPPPGPRRGARSGKKPRRPRR